MVVAEIPLALSRTKTIEAPRQSSYWQELLEKEKISKTKATRLERLVKKNKLTFDGFRERDDRRGKQYVSNLIYKDGELAAHVEFMIPPGASVKVEVQAAFETEIPLELVNFLIEGFNKYPHYWNLHTMALHELSCK